MSFNMLELRDLEYCIQNSINELKRDLRHPQGRDRQEVEEINQDLTRYVQLLDKILNIIRS